MALSFSVVSKTHGLCAVFFGVVFLFASFGMSLPIIGPAALLSGWDTSNESLNFMTRFLAGILFGLGYFEFVLASHESTKKIYVRYHIVFVILLLYSSIGAATYWLGWLYATLATLFLVAGWMGTSEGYSGI